MINDGFLFENTTNNEEPLEEKVAELKIEVDNPELVNTLCKEANKCKFPI